MMQYGSASDIKQSGNNDRKLFAAANSGKGFKSFYSEVFDLSKIKRRYLIKGGPGTGKSTLMRRVAEAVARNGGTVEYYFCSSDPSSLDGIIIDGEIAILDSTAPHAVEPELVGARDSIIDLGAFWSCEALASQREEISALTEQKKRAYALAYRFLSSAMQSDIASREILLPYVNKGYLKRLAARLVRSVRSDGEYACKIGLTRAIGMKGACLLDTYEQISERVIYIEDFYGLGFLLLSFICERALENKNKISVSYNPLNPDLPDGVYFEGAKIYFAVLNKADKKGKKSKENKENKTVSIRRALDFGVALKKEKKSALERAKNAKKLSLALELAAVDELKIAGEAHFALEEIYKSAMDYMALDKFMNEFVLSFCS